MTILLDPFYEQHALQCGYFTVNGFFLLAKAILGAVSIVLAFNVDEPELNLLTDDHDARWALKGHILRLDAGVLTEHRRTTVVTQGELVESVHWGLNELLGVVEGVNAHHWYHEDRDE